MSKLIEKICAKKRQAFSFSLCCAIVGLSAIFFYPTLASLSEAWLKPEYSHCWSLVIFAFGWAGYLYSKSKLSVKPSLFGLLIILLAVVMNSFGTLAANNWINEYSVVLMISGLVVGLAGTSIFETVLAPIFLLSFVVPLPPIMLASLTAELQLISSTLSVVGLNILDIPVYQEGNIIDLGNYKLQVAEACSGLRYLFPLMSFGYLFAFLFEKTCWKRIALVVITIPVTILMNALRIILVGVTVNEWGTEAADGLLHDFEGWAVFLCCIVLLFLFHGIISKFGLNPNSGIRVKEKQVIANQNLKKTVPNYTLILVLMIISLFGQKFYILDRVEVIPDRHTFSEFPLHLSQWTGQLSNLPADQVKGLKFTDYFIADYRSAASPVPITLYIAYYASQRREAAPHSPLVCIGGSGWEIVSLNENYSIKSLADKSFSVNRAVIKKGMDTELVYFWFRERGRDLSSPLAVKWYLLKDSLSSGRTDGALIRASANVNSEIDLQNEDKTLADFVQSILSALPDFVPN